MTHSPFTFNCDDANLKWWIRREKDREKKSYLKVIHKTYRIICNWNNFCDPTAEMQFIGEVLKITEYWHAIK